ncbi:MAG TPA: prenyltransferase/squalene oxidase repeat-containing protein [Planctomycetaceae bacterium]|nr:prenyltransferase/squalene oxidase repeat-containing protein [Planctomycetaceae bacterium]
MVVADRFPNAGLPRENRFRAAAGRGFRYLKQAQRPDGSWLPLWFGDQYAPDDINPTYGTARVLAAYRDADALGNPSAQRGLAWLLAHQNPDGGWGGVRGTPSSVEETALATEILLSSDPHGEPARRGVAWLLHRVEGGSFREPAPIGFYFARLWYFERLYPLIFTTAALRRAVRVYC